MPTYRLTPQAAADGVAGGSFAFGPLSETFDITKALQEGGGSFFTDNRSLESVLNDQWAGVLEVVSDAPVEPEVVEPEPEPAPDPPAKIFGRQPDVAAVHGDEDGDS